MQEIVELIERRTATDVVFEKLQDEIMSLELLPGTKLSEVEVANRFEVSRQPVRDAFNRLANLDLLLIRPQRATEVRGFLIQRINHARFVRLSVELEVMRRACSIWDDGKAALLEKNLDQQHTAITSGKFDRFHSLDSKFHELICELADCPLAIETFKQCRQKIDRLCTLSIVRQSEAATVLEDHQKIARALQKRSIDTAMEIVRQHLSRLDATIDDIHLEHAEYFE